jgi:putative copper resistance protein D
MSMTALLVFVRAIHFGATVLTAGALVFDLIALPSGASGARRKVALLVRWGAAAGLISAALWIAAQGAMIGGELAAAVNPSLLRTLVVETQFGRVMTMRMLLFAVLILGGSSWRLPGLVLGLALAGSLAWCGHAAAGMGVTGDIHLAADAIHCVAASAWVGGLVCLVYALRLTDEDRAIAIARRFSTLALFSVAALLASGLVNVWFLVGTPARLFATEYGRTLLVKIALFLAMLAIAAVSRWHVMPRIAFPGNIATLRRNTLAEACLGALVLCVVAWLGILPPAGHFH